MGVKLSGMKELRNSLNSQSNISKIVAPVVRQNGAELQQKAQRCAPVDTGNLRRSIQLSIKDNGMTAEVAAAAEYSAYVEYGTRFMNAQPYVKPAFNEQKDIFINDLKKAMNRR